MATADEARAELARRELARRKEQARIKEIGPIKAGMIAGGETLTSLGRGAGGAFLSAFGYPEKAEAMRQQQRRESALVAPLREEYPVSTTVGDIAVTAPVPGGTSAKAAALIGAGMGALDVRNDVTTGALTGAAGGAIGNLGARALGRFISPGGAVADKEANRQFRDAAKRIGYKPTAGQTTGSRGIQSLESGARALPGAGGAFEALDEANQAALNRAALKSIGEQGEEITDRVLLQANDRIGKEFERLAKGRTVTIRARDRLAINDLADKFIAELRSARLAGEAAVVEDLKDILSATNVPAERLALQASIFSRVARGSGDNLNLRTMAEQAGDMLRKIVADDLPADEKAAYNLARKHWRNLRALDRRGSVNTATGDVSPRGVASALETIDKRQFKLGKNNRDELMDIARIGRTPMRSYGDSGTAERMLSGGGILGAGGAGAYAAMTGDMTPLLALGATYGTGAAAGNALASDTVQKVLSSQVLTPRQMAIIGDIGARIGRGASTDAERRLQAIRGN